MRDRSVKWMISLIIFLVMASNSALGQGRCGIALDYVVQAREQARPDLSREELTRINMLLKRADNICPGLGDVYYYRHLYERQLGNKALADLNYKKAQEFNSEALRFGYDPFKNTEVEIRVSTTLREKWALVIGIRSFQNGISPLRFSDKDALDFAALLKDPNIGRFKPENIRILTNENATTLRIKESLSWLGRMATSDDLVVIFISSHGTPRQMDTAGVSYVATYDTDVRDQDRLFATAYPMVDIMETMSSRINAGRMALFLDTCYSGAITGGQSQLTGSKPLILEAETGGAGVSETIMNRFKSNQRLRIITASRHDERSWESENLKNGFFTFYLIEALKQNQGQLPIEQVFEYLKDRVYTRVQSEKGIAQTPTLTPDKSNINYVMGAQTR